jgi:Tfp pilus assembly protein PilV
MTILSQKLKIPSHKSKGFTLIEVMVASVILFSSIAVVSVIYRGAFISSQKAERHVEISGTLPSILANIRSEIRAKGNSDSSEIISQSSAWQVQYQWQAKLLTIKAAAPTFSPESGLMETTKARYKFWQVELTVTLNSTTKNYTFNEVSWSDES